MPFIDSKITVTVPQEKKDVLKGEYMGCHPCINTSSIRFTTKDFLEKIVKALGHDYIVVKLTDGNQ